MSTQSSSEYLPLARVRSEPDHHDEHDDDPERPQERRDRDVEDALGAVALALAIGSHLPSLVGPRPGAWTGRRRAAPARSLPGSIGVTGLRSD